MDLDDVYRTFHPTSTRCTFFTAAHETFPQNRSYPRAQSKPQKIQENRNYTMHAI
jgi:hypothetical protein